MDTKKLRQKILDLAIRGKLVPQDPNDEPASVLLERIKAEKERLIKEGKIKRSKKSASDTSHYENVPFEIPESWEWTTFEDIADSLLGKMLDKKKVEGIPLKYLRNINVRWGYFELSDLLEMPFKAEEKDRYSIRKGDLVICEGGEPGRCAIWDNDTDIMYQKALHRMRPFYGISNQYLSFVLMQYSNSGYLEKYYTGSTIKHLTGESLSSIPVPIPSYHEQQQIVCEIDKWFTFIDSIDENKLSLLSAIEQAKSKVLLLAVSGKLVPQELNDEPATELLKRINPNIEIPCDNPHYQKLPNGWAMTSMQNICQLRDGEKQSDIPRINLDVKYLRGKSEGEIVSSGKYVPSGSTMILVDGENSGEIFTSVIDGYQGSTFKLLDVSSEMNMGFVLLVIKNHQQEFRENKVGSAIPHLNKKLFKEIAVMIPPIEEQQRIVESTQQYLNLLELISDKL